MDVKIIDVNFFAPQVIASYLIETSEGPIIIETGPDTTFNNLEKGLAEHGYKVSDIKNVFVTHIHLDHSGAAWHFAKEGASVYVHPRGAPHLVAPERLMASAAMIYGDQMDELWGTVEGIDEDKVIAVEDGQVIKIGDTEITVHESIGHANHHNAYQIEDSLFTGDVAGCRIENGPTLPPTPPPDIHVERWHASIEKIKKINPKELYLTHFGKFTNVNEHLGDLMEHLDEWSEWMGQRARDGKTEEEIIPDFLIFYKTYFDEPGVTEEIFEKYESADPHWMNVSGLLRYWNKYQLAEK